MDSPWVAASEGCDERLDVSRLRLGQARWNVGSCGGLSNDGLFRQWFSKRCGVSLALPFGCARFFRSNGVSKKRCRHDRIGIFRAKARVAVLTRSSFVFWGLSREKPNLTVSSESVMITIQSGGQLVLLSRKPRGTFSLAASYVKSVLCIFIAIYFF